MREHVGNNYFSFILGKEVHFSSGFYSLSLLTIYIDEIIKTELTSETKKRITISSGKPEAGVSRGNFYLSQ
jgi:hypothetical protein